MIVPKNAAIQMVTKYIFPESFDFLCWFEINMPTITNNKYKIDMVTCGLYESMRLLLTKSSNRIKSIKAKAVNANAKKMIQVMALIKRILNS